MKELSFLEFKEYCDTMKPKEIILDTDNQSWAKLGEPMKMKLVFDKIQFFFNPNAMYVVSACGKVSFERVQRVIHVDVCTIGEVFTIIYGDMKSFTLVMR